MKYSVPMDFRKTETGVRTQASGGCSEEAMSALRVGDPMAQSFGSQRRREGQPSAVGREQESWTHCTGGKAEWPEHVQTHTIAEMEMIIVRTYRST